MAGISPAARDARPAAVRFLISCRLNSIICRPRLRAQLKKPATARGLCPLLHEGQCVLYEHRPVICRTHGMPLVVEENGLQRIDCCPENFREGALNTLSGDSLLHLERVNLLLVSVNHIYAASRNIDAGQRISIARIFSPVTTLP